MWPSSSTLAPPGTCLSPFSNTYLRIPSTTYRHTVELTSEQPSSYTAIKNVHVQIRVQGWYKLYIQPTREHAMLTMDEDYLVSPVFSCNFKLPLFLSAYRFYCEISIQEELNKLLLPLDLEQYLKPFIVESVLGLARRRPEDFKVVFDVKIAKIELANHEECDSYRRRGLV